MGKALLDGWAIDPNGDTALVPDDVLGSGALMNLGGDRDHSGHKGFCLSAMVDILCAVLSGGKWGPTVGALIPHLCPSNLCASRPAETLEFRRADGFTTNKLQAMFAGDGDAASNGHADKAQEQDDDEEESTGIVSPSWHRTQLRDAILAAAPVVGLVFMPGCEVGESAVVADNPRAFFFCVAEGHPEGAFG